MGETARKKMITDAMDRWKGLTPEQRGEIRKRRLESLRQSTGDSVARTDGLSGNWEFPNTKPDQE